MYVVRNDETGKIMGERLSESEAYELRDTFLNWEDMVIEWMDTEADVLLEEIHDRHDKIVDFTIDDKLDIRFSFRKDENGMITAFNLVGRFGQVLMTTKVDTITTSWNNDKIVINGSTVIDVTDLVVVE